MPTISEGELEFDFPEGWQVSKFDAWSFYRNQFQNVCGGTKAMDLLAIEENHCVWVIEVKDYRRNRRTKTIDLAEEVAFKVRDTLVGLFVAKIHANDADEKQWAINAGRCERLRIVLHLEQPASPSKLFPRAIDPADVQQRLKQLIKAIDPHPLVVESQRMSNVAWTVA